MTSERQKLAVVAVWAVLFGTASLHSHSEVCCMFMSTRHYGWPYPYISLYKEVETYDEAAQVYSQPARTLLDRGWRPAFAGDLTGPDAGLGLFVDLGLCIFAANLLLAGWRMIWPKCPGDKTLS